MNIGIIIKILKRNQQKGDLMSEKNDWIEKKEVKYNKYQQGDVVIFRVDRETFEKNTRNGKEYRTAYNTQSHNNAVLAFGEVTGHKHQIHMKEMLDAAEVTLSMGYNGTAGEDVPEGFQVCNETVTLKHEEHNPVDIPPGYYLVRIVREMDHITGRARYVAD